MDDHKLFSSALQKRFEHDPGFEIVGVASDGGSAVRMAGEIAPDIVLLDASDPELDTVAATREITERKPPPTVLVLVAASDELDGVEAHSAGATAILRKPRSTDDLLETVELATTLVGAAVAR